MQQVRKTIATLKKGDLVKYIWEDAAGVLGWVNLTSEDRSGIIVTSVGQFIAVSVDDYLMTAGESDGTLTNRNHFVPVKNIKTIRKVS